MDHPRAMIRSSEQQDLGEAVGARRRPLTALRRSPWLIKMKKMGASDQDQILALKKERKALIQSRKERIVREGNLEEYLAGVTTYDSRDRQQGTGSNQQDCCKAAVEGSAGNKQRKKKVNNNGNKKKKVVKERVPQKAIDFMIVNRHSHKAYPFIREEHLGKRSESFRESYYEAVAMANNLMEYEEAIVKQFRNKGYAYDYFEVTDDDEEENDGNDDVQEEN